MKNLPKILILGRPNVGKSTIFNRLLKRRQALVHNVPGVTRDLHFGHLEWWQGGKLFSAELIDSGGLGEGIFDKEIREQVYTLLPSLRAILFVVDAQTGIHPEDEALLRELRKQDLNRNVAVLGLVNKIDLPAHEERVSEFFGLGLSEWFAFSAEHDRGVDTVLERLSAEMAASDTETAELQKTHDVQENDKEADRRPVRVAIVGRPNVGKSTLLNALLNKSRMITSPIPGTTVDAVESELVVGDRKIVFIDTAGIRQKSKTKKGIEVLSVVQTKKALRTADVAVLVLDGEEGISDQDEKVASLVLESGCSVILAINKWDTQTSEEKFSRKDALKIIGEEFSFLAYAPVHFLSALHKKGLKELLKGIFKVAEPRRLQLPSHELTEWMRREIESQNPFEAKFYFCHQVGKKPPSFVCHVNHPKKVHFSLERQLVNQMRRKWGFEGTPIRLKFVGREGSATR